MFLPLPLNVYKVRLKQGFGSVGHCKVYFFVAVEFGLRLFYPNQYVVNFSICAILPKYYWKGRKLIHLSASPML